MEDFDFLKDQLGGERKKAMEIGCGRTAKLTKSLLAGLYEEVLALDVSDEAVERAREALKDAKNVEVALKDACEELNRRDFDAVFLLSALHFAEKPQLVLREAVKALKPGGVLVILTGDLTFEHSVKEFCLKNFSMEMEEHWSGRVEGDFDKFCHPKRASKHFEGLKLVKCFEAEKESEVSLLDLPEIVSEFQICRLFSAKWGENDLQELMRELQSEILTKLNHSREDLYFEDIKINLMRTYYVEIHQKKT